MAQKPFKKNTQKSGSKSNYKSVPPKKEVKVAKDTVFTYKPNLTVVDVANGFGVSSAVIIKKLIPLGKMAVINDVLDRDTIELLALDFGVEVQDEVITDVSRFDEMEVVDDPADLVKRSPIITIMGHVDHGKTTLLDAIRHSRVVSGEAGGITQHIGAYQVDWQGEKITFIDTPGHAAFTEMRARGAKVTDICILVVAADDGVKPQTIEALEHAKAADVPIIVAVNKIDKPDANPDNVMSELANHGLLPEAWGGKTPYIQVSALKKQGLNELLDVILLMAEIEELKANPKRPAKGTVIEASLDKGRGAVATLIVETGTLHVGDMVVVGTTYGKIRTMNDDLKHRFNEATPAQPVEVTGLNKVPKAGDIFMVVVDERQARSVAETREAREKEDERRMTQVSSLDNMFNQLESQEKVLNIVLKGDVQGSLEALKGMLAEINIDGFHVNVIRSAVGAISETDITLAATSKAIVIGFNVRPSAVVKALANQQGVEIRLYNIVYRITEDIEKALKGMLEPTFEEVVTGQVEVRETFKVSKIGTIAGCFVTDGFVKKDALVRVIREGIVIYEGALSSLKRFKDDVKEVKQGYECGLSIANFNDIKVGDIIEASTMKQVEA